MEQTFTGQTFTGHTSGPNHRLVERRPGRWYPVDFARGGLLRPLGNPACIPVSPSGRRYQNLSGQPITGQSLAGLGLTLHDIGGGRWIDPVQQDQILADLRDAGVPARQSAWLALRTLHGFDRVLLARDARHGRCEALLLAELRDAAGEPFLVIEVLGSASVTRGEPLLQRMLAFLILRLDTIDPRPAAILARTRNPSLCRVLHHMSGRIAGAGFHPEPETRVIPLRTAGLAHRMARAAGPDRRFDVTRQVLECAASGPPADGPMIAALDLRFTEEAALTEDARRLFRPRLPRPVALPSGRTD